MQSAEHIMIVEGLFAMEGKEELEKKEREKKPGRADRAKKMKY
jgi:hypothetical protein